MARLTVQSTYLLMSRVCVAVPTATRLVLFSGVGSRCVQLGCTGSPLFAMRTSSLGRRELWPCSRLWEDPSC